MSSRNPSPAPSPAPSPEPSFDSERLSSPSVASLRLLTEFRRRCPGVSRAIHVRAPGRLNLIGEHTDYSGLPVLPFAVGASIEALLVASDTSDSEIHSLDFPGEPPARFRLAAAIAPDPAGSWVNYVKAAAQDAVAYGDGQGMDPAALRGLRGVVRGDIPMNAGLSSSSALVVAMQLAFFHAQGWSLPAIELAQRAADAEHYVGTRGGGMDQATSLCARPGHALKMYFHPLEIEHVPVATRCSFVVAHSTVDARKSADVRRHYNQRVFECRCIALLLRETVQREGLLPNPLRYLGDLRRAFPPGPPPAEPLRHLLDSLNPEPYNWKDVIGFVGRETIDRWLRADFPHLRDNPPASLPLRRRAEYLLGEWGRVEQAASCLRAGDLSRLGALLYEAHDGLARQFEVSHPRVDRLVGLAREYGLPGARLVGAGFGGVTLHLVPPGQESDYARFLEKRFYDDVAPGIPAASFLHTFHPSAGACVRDVEV